MFDQTSIYTISIDLIILVLLYLCMRPVLVKSEDLTVNRLRFSILLIVFFCVMATWSGDWYHYQTIFDTLKADPDNTSHMEGIYDFLIQEVCPFYLSFRLIVWGAALGLFGFAIKRLGLDANYAWCILGLGFLPFFSYARVSIVPAILIVGASLCFAPFARRRGLSLCMGLLLLVLSLFFHKTAFFGLLVMLFCFFVPQTTKNSWFYFMLGFLVASVILRYVFQSLLSLDFSNEVAISDFVDKTKGTSSSFVYFNLSVGPLTTALFEHVPYFLTAFLAFKIQNQYEAPRPIMTIIKFEFYMVIFSMLFLLDLGTSTSLLYGRFLRFSILPGVITLAYARQYGLFKKLTSTIITLAVIGSFYQIIYEMYCAIYR